MLVVHLHVAVEFFRPVALGADVLRGTELLERGGDGAVVGVEGVGDELVGAVDLGLDEPLGARADVALHAADAGVRAALVGDEFGVHRLVAHLAAKLDRLGIMVGLVAAEGAQHDEAHGAGAEQHHHAALRGVGEVEAPLVRHGGRVLDGPAALRPGAEEHQRQAGDQETRRDDVGEDAEVGVRVPLREVHPHQQREREQRPDGDDAADGADPVVEVRTGRGGRGRGGRGYGHGWEGGRAVTGPGSAQALNLRM